MSPEDLKKIEVDYAYLCHVLRNGMAMMASLMRQMETVLSCMSEARMAFGDTLKNLEGTGKPDHEHPAKMQ